MEILKKFFNDDSTIIGLCKFKNLKSHQSNLSKHDFLFENAYSLENVFNTNYKENILL